MIFRFLVTLFLVTFAGNTASAQTCESIFNTSVLSRFTVEDQEALTTLARKQVELSFNFSISKVQKDAALNHLAEQLEIFIADSRLTTQQEQTLRREYRALVFQFKKELSGELDIQICKVSAKQDVIKKQTEDKQNYIQLKKLFSKYNVTEPIQLLKTLIERQPHPENEMEFKFALNYLPDVNIRRLSKTLLETAILSNNIGIVKILLESKGINIEAELGYKSPLHLALQSDAALLAGSTEIVQLLINKGVDVNAKDSKGTAPIHWAIERSEFPELLDVLLQAPTLDINATNSFMHTPLQSALYQLALHLVNHPPDYRITTQVNATVKKLLLIPNIDINCEHQMQVPFEIAMSTNNFEAAKLLIAHPSFNVNAKNYSQKTPLHMAVKNQEILNLLLDKGADINAIDSNKQTALHWAVSSKDNYNPTAIEVLIERGANLNTVDSRGNTPFQSAILFATVDNQFQRVKSLLKAKNINLNLKGRIGDSVEEALLKIRNHIGPELQEFYKSRGLEK